MTDDWPAVCRLAKSLHVEEWGKELWLVRHDGPVVDAEVEFPAYPRSGRLVNLPFRPHVLLAKASRQEAVAAFSARPEVLALGAYAVTEGK